MSLHDFSIQSPSTVILDDDRDPDVSWRHHQERAGAANGGVDTVAPVGTPVHAWADGVVERIPNNGSAGNVARVHLSNDPGWKHDFKHLSGYVDLVNGFARKGQVIGYSGTSGGVAPHLHQNLVDPSGVRQNPWHYVSGDTAGGDVTPIPTNQEEEGDMYVVWDTSSGRVYTMGQQFIRHEAFLPGFDGSDTSSAGKPITDGWFTVNVTAADDRVIQATWPQFVALCDSFGIPRDKIPVDKSKPGARWSAADDILAGQARIEAALSALGK